jgi:hypothetical protein
MNVGKHKQAIVASTVGGLAVLALGGFGVQSAEAASSNNAGSGSTNATDSRYPGPPPGHRGPGGPMGMHFGGRDGGEPLHGEEVVKTAGGIKTMRNQSGNVTEVSSDSLTVLSSDGFTATYVVNGDTQVGKNGKPSTIAALKVGDTVHVFGEVSGDVVNAKGVMSGKPPKFVRKATPIPTSSSTTNG